MFMVEAWTPNAWFSVVTSKCYVKLLPKLLQKPSGIPVGLIYCRIESHIIDNSYGEIIQKNNLAFCIQPCNRFCRPFCFHLFF